MPIRPPKPGPMHMLLAAGLLLSAGCVLSTGNDPDCASCAPDADASTPADGASPDAALDGGPDGSPDGGDAAVRCTRDQDCTGATPRCDTTSGTCVGCLSNDDCTSAEASRCADTTKTCAPCTARAHCDHLGGTPACADGTCAACTPATETTDCPGTACDPARFTCTDVLLGTREPCQTCVADSECTPGSRCIAMTFQGSPLGGRCLPIRQGSCTRPYSSLLSDAVSLSGAAAAEYCTITTSTTCDAVRDLIDFKECSTNDDCGRPGVNDGVCGRVGGVENQCTYACNSAADCLSAGAGSTCGGGRCGG